jgi:hypothetical protein
MTNHMLELLCRQLLQMVAVILERLQKIQILRKNISPNKSVI